MIHFHIILILCSPNFSDAKLSKHFFTIPYLPPLVQKTCYKSRRVKDPEGLLADQRCNPARNSRGKDKSSSKGLFLEFLIISCIITNNH